MFVRSSLAFSLLASLVAASPAPAHDHEHALVARGGALPGRWYHPRDHPAHRMFARTHDHQWEKRQGVNAPNGPVSSGTATSASPSATPSVGSPAWAALYPSSTPPASSIPAAWTSALAAAVAAGSIPNVPQTTESGGNSPVYPASVKNPNDPSVCNGGGFSCRIPGNVWDAPNGTIGIGFDDGPTENSPPLYTFLKQQKQTATHFMIGVNILANPATFLQAYQDNGDDIAVHTWTHPYMTSLSNSDVVAQLGWTLQIVHDSTGGKLPRFWRPPYGDIDTRVSAIAQEVFGLTAILWNHDSADWTIPTGPQTIAGVQANMKQWLSGAKSPGLIVLEHELYSQTVQAFIEAYPMVAQFGWKAVSMAQLNASAPVWQGGGGGGQAGVAGSGDDLSDGGFAADRAASTSSSALTSSALTSSASTSSVPGNATGTGTASGAAKSTAASVKPSGAAHVRPSTTSALILVLAAALVLAPL